MFDGRELPITEDILLKWRVIIEEGRKRGYTFSQDVEGVRKIVAPTPSTQFSTS